MDKPIDKKSIEAYFRGALDAETAEKLKAEVEQDEGLREEFEWYRDITKAIEWQGILAEAEAERQLELNGLTKANASTRPRPIQMVSNRWWAYAAVGLVLIVAGSLWWGNVNYSNLSLAELGMDRLNLKEGIDNLRNTEWVQTDPFVQGLEAVEAGRWPDAADFFSGITDTSTLFIQAQLYLAYTRLEQGQYAKVQASAEIVDQQSLDTRQRQKAQWMMVQAMVALGGKDETLDLLLDKISIDQSHMFQREALSLKRKFNSRWRRLVW